MSLCPAQISNTTAAKIGDNEVVLANVQLTAADVGKWLIVDENAAVKSNRRYNTQQACAAACRAFAMPKALPAVKSKDFLDPDTIGNIINADNALEMALFDVAYHSKKLEDAKRRQVLAEKELLERAAVHAERIATSKSLAKIHKRLTELQQTLQVSEEALQPT
jgi:hypothetical protein